MTKVLMHRRGTNLLYPNPTRDGLKIWYNFAGKRNTDNDRNIIEDLSGNNNDGNLQNFNFTEESGYKDNTLVFDGVDDKLIIPELELDETAMSVMHDGKIYSYEDDKVLTVGEDGEIVGGGRNLIQGGVYGIQVWSNNNITTPVIVNQKLGYYEVETTGDADNLSLYTNSMYNLPAGTETTHSFEVWSPVDIKIRLSVHSGRDEFHVPKETWTTIFREKIISTGEDQRMVGFRTDVANHGNPIRYRKAAVVVGDYKGYNPHPSDYKTTTLTPTLVTDLQLYNKTLHKDELLHNAESKGLKKLKPGVVVQEGLMLHYDFSHESNTSEYKDKAFDYSGNGNHGVLNNFNFTEESGYVGNKLLFDGVDDWFETQKIGLAQTSGIKNWTFDFTLDLQSESTRGSILNIPFNPDRLSIKSFEDAIAIGRFYNGYWWGRATPTLNRGKNNIVILCELLSTQETSTPSMNLTVYVNGKIVELLFSPSSGYYSNIVNFLHVGWQGTDASQPQNAYLDEGIHSIKIYPRLLTPEEIQHNYQIEKEKFNIVEGEM